MHEQALSPEQFHQELYSLRQSYHLEHQFQVMMNEGKLSREQMQGWVINRYYYQQAIPLKDGAILSNCPDREVRRHWATRIIDQDGIQGAEGGLECWIALGIACGLSRETVTCLKHVLPSVRFAVDAYVNFAKTAPWQEAVCASLTELFAGEAHKRRLEAFPIYYPWIGDEGLSYFRNRLSQAKRDVDHGLQITLAHFNTRPLQQRAKEILKFKMDILWTMLDAMELAYVTQASRKENFTWLAP